MKHTYNGEIDIKGIQKMVTMLAIASGLAGWAVLARPEASAATVAITTSAPIVQTSAQAGGSSAASTLSSAASSTSAVQVVTAVPTVASLPVVAAPVPTASIQVVAPVQVPVASTRSSR